MRLTVVTNRLMCHSWKEFITRLEDLSFTLKQGDRIVLNEPDLPKDEYLRIAKDIQEICFDSHVRLVVNDLYTASKLKLNRIHLNLTELLETSVPKNILPSVSVESLEDAILAEKNGAKTIIVDHVYTGDCHGIQMVKDVIEAVDVPVYAQGGVTVEKTHELHDIGVEGVCVCSHFMTCDDVIKEGKRYKALKY